MGRRPNPLISEFFERGKQIKDASNRYEHTCKYCKERFEKGRIETLINHLLKNCPVLPARDRQRAVLQFHQGPRTSVSSISSNGNGANRRPAQLLAPAPPAPGLSALETLAEVSHTIPSSLQVAASAATELMRPASTTGEQSSSDVLPDERMTSLYSKLSTHPPPIDPRLHDGSEEIEHELAKAADLLHPIRSQTLPLQVIAVTDPKPRGRERFSATRRQEVRNVRKMGACMRCRMLKKSCSSGAPCAECNSINKARVWKYPCVRAARIEDECTLWSCGLYSIRAYQAVSRIKEFVQFETTPGTVELRLESDPSVFATFNTLRGVRLVPDLLSAVLEREGITDPNTVQILASETDDTLGKLEQLTQGLVPSCHGEEMPPLMRVTVQHRQRIPDQEPTVLVMRAMELWVCTNILYNQLSLSLVLNPTGLAEVGPLTQSVSKKKDGDPSQVGRPLTPESDPKTHELIFKQLVGAVEKRAANLAKFVMKELERRFLERQQADQFETFLVSIILLACVERMCSLYRSFDSDAVPRHKASAAEHHPPSDGHEFSDLARQLHAACSQTEEVSNEPEHAGQGHEWPLEKPPSFYYEQGERFSDIINMLLKMRQGGDMMHLAKELGLNVEAE